MRGLAAFTILGCILAASATQAGGLDSPPPTAPLHDAAAALTVNLPHVGTRQCILASSPDATETDRLVSVFPQTGKTLDDSFNCFFYAQTAIEGMLPPGMSRPSPLDPTRGIRETQHKAPSTDYFDESFLTAHGYSLAFATTDMTVGKFQPGDVILVPGQDPNVNMNEKYDHAAIVLGTRGDAISRIRQKASPFLCVVDLTPQEFNAVYPPTLPAGDTPPALYQVYRRKQTCGTAKMVSRESTGQQSAGQQSAGQASGCPATPPEPQIGPPVPSRGPTCVATVFEESEGCVCPPGYHPTRLGTGSPTTIWCRWNQRVRM
jgi:hypothetical protein